MDTHGIMVELTILTFFSSSWPWPVGGAGKRLGGRCVAKKLEDKDEIMARVGGWSTGW
jgi:hypothetical protein